MRPSWHATLAAGHPHGVNPARTGSYQVGGQAVMTRRTKWILGGVAAVVVVGAVAAAVAAKNRPKGTRVRTTTVTRGDLVSLVTANGTLEAETKVDLSANIMG